MNGRRHLYNRGCNTTELSLLIRGSLVNPIFQPYITTGKFRSPGGGNKSEVSDQRGPGPTGDLRDRTDAVVYSGGTLCSYGEW